MQITRWGNLNMPIRIHTMIVGTAMRLKDKQLTFAELEAEMIKLHEYFDKAARHDELLRIKAATVHDDVWSVDGNGQVVSLNDRVAELER